MAAYGPSPNQSRADNGLGQAGASTVSFARKSHGQARNHRGEYRNFRVEDTRPTSFSLTTKDWNNKFADALHRHMEAAEIGEKELANKLGCNDRTLENWLQARTSASGVDLLKCISVVPELASAVDEVCFMESEFDPDVERAKMDVVRMAWKLIDLREERAERREREKSNGKSEQE